MAKVLCENLTYMYFDVPEEMKKWDKGVEDGSYLSDKEFLKYSGDLPFFRGYNGNGHHLPPSFYYEKVLPDLEDKFHFGYNRKDFKIVKMSSSNGKYDLSYLYPRKDDAKYHIEVNGKDVNGHEFSDLTGLDRDTIGEGCTLYHRLFVGSHACCRVVNLSSNTNGKSIIISGDSMMIPVIPILCKYYAVVVYLDNRDGESHKEYFDNMVFNDGIVEFWSYDPWYPEKKINGNFI